MSLRDITDCINIGWHMTGHPYLKHLREDNLLAPILLKEIALPEKAQDTVFFLFSSIVRQQLSAKAGGTIFGHFLDYFQGEHPTSSQIANTRVEDLRALGMSWNKARYLKNVAAFDLSDGLGAERFREMTDEEAIAYLTSIAGIGNWTANLFLISALGREDVMPFGDIILQRAVAALYGLERKDKKFLKTMQSLAEKWRPYRSFAALHLWNWTVPPDLG